ncbi:serine hydrolase [Pedobacter mucosus]|uniref:serine hydrolase n=1 Tax=Pedobacter mucosus TaxID=2895286 RepID=UPI001EE3D06F|nr:serine hydrolase [Pedobacter mucosus]UKT63776.1 class A beta-lactamase-related serine hydrolase [Pedobacter mucosus]
MIKILWCLSLSLFLSFNSQAQNLDQVIKFIKENPKKCSVYLIENGKNTIKYNSSQLMPLASAAKTIIAIEFADQVASKKINPYTNIAVNDLAKYYLPFTDGGAHPAWLKSLGKKAGDSVSLLAVAQGMIRYSSNANTEYLEDLLGLENINKSIKTINLKDHQPLYYFTAAALMTSAKPKDFDESAWLKKLNGMSIEEYRRKCDENHLKLKTDSSFIKTLNANSLSGNIQKFWSDRLVSSTTETYALLMQKINSGTFFKKDVQQVLESVMEWPMLFTGNQQVFTHLGQKGGSTAFVLTDAFYATDKKGNTLSCAFFFNDLTKEESNLITSNFGAFEAGIITNQKFRTKLAEGLK